MVSCPIFLVSTETFSSWSLRFDLGPPPEVAPQLPQAEAWGCCNEIPKKMEKLNFSRKSLCFLVGFYWLS